MIKKISRTYNQRMNFFRSICLGLLRRGLVVSTFDLKTAKSKIERLITKIKKASQHSKVHQIRMARKFFTNRINAVEFVDFVNSRITRQSGYLRFIRVMKKPDSLYRKGDGAKSYLLTFSHLKLACY